MKSLNPEYFEKQLITQNLLQTIRPLRFKVSDVSTSVSKTGSGDIWMSYILDKPPVK